ncbi:unnamed protein product [Discosporangium mesarthrocarpum]
MSEWPLATLELSIKGLGMVRRELGLGLGLIYQAMKWEIKGTARVRIEVRGRARVRSENRPFFVQLYGSVLCTDRCTVLLSERSHRTPRYTALHCVHTQMVCAMLLYLPRRASCARTWG